LPTPPTTCSAFAHARRTPSPVTATRVDGGWRFDGEAPWLTSWGLIDVFTIAGATDDGRLVWALLPAVATASVCPSEPLDLSVMAATGTVRLRVDGLLVADADVVAVQDLDAWRVADAVNAARLNPSVLGVMDTAHAMLRDLDKDCADTLRLDLGACAKRNEEVARANETGASDAGVEALAEARAWALVLCRRITTALLAAAGGSAMERSHPAQRLCREAAFYVVQAQSEAGRAAMLKRTAMR
jgi:hypothetical protein